MNEKRIRQFEIGFASVFDYANKSKPTNSKWNYFIKIERFWGGKIQSIRQIGDMAYNKHNFDIDNEKHNFFFLTRAYVRCQLSKLV